MAEARRLTDLIHGHVGRLTYVPPENATSQLGSLHTSRITSEGEFSACFAPHAMLTTYPQRRTSESLDLQQSYIRHQSHRLQKARRISGRNAGPKDDGFSSRILKPSWATQPCRVSWRRV